MTMQTWFTFIAFSALMLALPIAAIVLWLKPQWWLNLLTLFIGVLVGLMDLQATQVQMTAFLMIAFGFFAGFVQPRRAWRWALMLGAWVPLFGAVAAAARLTNARGVDLVASFAAIAFALVGVYAGVVVKRLTPRKVAVNSDQ